MGDEEEALPPAPVPVQVAPPLGPPPLAYHRDRLGPYEPSELLSILDDMMLGKPTLEENVDSLTNYLLEFGVDVDADGKLTVPESSDIERMRRAANEKRIRVKAVTAARLAKRNMQINWQRPPVERPDQCRPAEEKLEEASRRRGVLFASDDGNGSLPGTTIAADEQLQGLGVPSTSPPPPAVNGSMLKSCLKGAPEKFTPPSSQGIGKDPDDSHAEGQSAQISMKEATSARSKARSTERSSRRMSVAQRSMKEATSARASVAAAMQLTDEEAEKIASYAALRKLAQVHEWWTNIKEPKREGCLARLVLSSWFGSVCLGVIILNTVYLTFSADFEMDRLDAKPEPTMVKIEMCFVIFYCSEILAKLVVHRIYFFCNEGMAWNLFDSTLVLQSLFGVFASTLINMENMSFARMLRLLKLGKIFRIFRTLRFLKELRVMILSILGSGIALFWSLIMLGLILYIFGLLFIQTMTGFLLDNKESLDADTIEATQRYFGTVATSMLTLYQSVSGGMDWIEIYDLVSLSGPFGAVILILFLIFFNFSVMNILTGIFLEKAFANSQPDREAKMLEQRRKEAQSAADLNELFHDMDRDGSGMITFDEFMRHLEDEEVQLQLSWMGLNVTDAAMFFKVLVEASGGEVLPIDDVIRHCTKIKGGASAVDLQSFQYEVKHMHREILETIRRQSQRLSEQH